MSALPDNHIMRRKGINWLNDRVAFDRFTGEMAFDRIGIIFPQGVIGHLTLFNRLPNFVLTSNLSPYAKIIYADIFSWCFVKDKKGNPAIREYFFGIRAMAERNHMTRQSAHKAVQKLIEGGWIGVAPARESSGIRKKLVPLNTVAASDATTPVSPDVTFEVVSPGEATERAAASELLAMREADRKAQDEPFDDLDEFFEEPVPDTLKETTTKPGIPMPYAVARRLNMVPLFLNVLRMRGSSIVNTAELFVYGLMTKLADPFYFASDTRTARAVGMHRTTVKTALERLEYLHMITSSDHGYYICAHPILNSDPQDAVNQHNYLRKLVKQEIQRCHGNS